MYVSFKAVRKAIGCNTAHNFDTCTVDYKNGKYCNKDKCVQEVHSA